MTATIYKMRDLARALHAAWLAYPRVVFRSFTDHMTAPQRPVRGIVPVVFTRGSYQEFAFREWVRRGAVLSMSSDDDVPMHECSVYRQCPISLNKLDDATEAIVLPVPPTWHYHEIRTDNFAPPRSTVIRLWMAIEVAKRREDPRLLHYAQAADMVPEGCVLVDQEDTTLHTQDIYGAFISLNEAHAVQIFRVIAAVKLLAPLWEVRSKALALYQRKKIEDAPDYDGLKLWALKPSDWWGLASAASTGALRFKTTWVVQPNTVTPDWDRVDCRHREQRIALRDIQQAVEAAPWFLDRTSRSAPESAQSSARSPGTADPAPPAPAPPSSANVVVLPVPGRWRRRASP